MGKMSDYAWMALEIFSVVLVWALKATAQLVGLALWLTMFVAWVLLVGLIFGRLPRPMMRYL